jgi:plastocyanin
MKKTFFSGFLTLLTGVFVNSQAFAGSLTIKAPFEGTAPAPQIVKADADPKCKLVHPNGIDPQQVVVNGNATLKNVFVYAKEGVTGTHEAPKEPVKLDQHGCEYQPKVFGVQAKQPIEIVNSDDTLHNVHALPTQSKEFNLGMPIKGMKLKKTFDKPEVMVKIKCEVHPWMAAYAGVLEHPFYGVTGEEGSAVIKDLPAGEYTIEAWHEKYGTQTQKVTMADADQEISFSFKEA